MQSNSFRESVVIWGGISKQGKTSLWISQKGQSVNSTIYCKIIKRHSIQLINNAYNGMQY